MTPFKEKMRRQREEAIKRGFAPYAFAALLRGTAKREKRLRAEAAKAAAV
jgi:hypothetical protein